MTSTEQQIDMYASRSPLFKQAAMSSEQIDIYDKMRTVEVPKFDISLPAAGARPSYVSKKRTQETQSSVPTTRS